MDTAIAAEADALDIPRLTAEQFNSWSLLQPEGEHYELYDGVVVRVPNEGSLHGLTKSRIAYRIMQAIDEAGLPCDV
jgi:Uma2 family endonuclease